MSDFYEDAAMIVVISRRKITTGHGVDLISLFNHQLFKIQKRMKFTAPAFSSKSMISNWFELIE